MGVQRGASIGEYQYSKKIDDGPIDISSSKKKSSCEHTHESYYLIYLLLIFTGAWKELQEEDKLPYLKVGFMIK